MGRDGHSKINRRRQRERLRRIRGPVRPVAAVKCGEDIALPREAQPRIRVAHRGLRIARIDRRARAAGRVARLEFVAAGVVVARLRRGENERHDVARICGERLAHHQPGLRVEVRIVERFDPRRDVEVAGLLRRDKAERISRAVNVRAARRDRVAAVQRLRAARLRRADVRARERAEIRAAGDRHVLRECAREEVGVGIVRAPFVSHAIDVARVVPHEHARLQPLVRRRIVVVGGKLEMLQPHGALRESPLARRRETDRLPGRDSEPARLVRAVAPERIHHRVAGESRRGRERREVAEKSRRAQGRRQRDRRTSRARELVDFSAEARHLAEVKLVVQVRAEARQADVIRAAARSPAVRQLAERDLRRGRRAFIEIPDRAVAVVAENIFPAEVAREFRAAIHVAADDRAALGVRVVDDRPLVHADERRREIAVQSLDAIPLKIQPLFRRLDHAHLLPRSEADIADEHALRHRIASHAMRAAQADAEKFLQHARLPDERIVVRDVVILRDRSGGQRLPRDRMRDAPAALIHIEAQHAAVKPAVNALRVHRVLRIVAIREIEETRVRVEKHAAAIVPDGLRDLIDQDRLARRIDDAAGIHGETREPIVAGLESIRPHCGRARHCAGSHPGVVDEDVAVVRRARAEVRMEGEREQPAIIPALALRRDVEHQDFVRIHRRRAFWKGIHAPLALPRDHAPRIRSLARHLGDAECVRDRDVRKCRHCGPRAGKRRRGGRQHAICERGESRPRGEAVLLRVRGGQAEDGCQTQDDEHKTTHELGNGRWVESRGGSLPRWTTSFNAQHRSPVAAPGQMD